MAVIIKNVKIKSCILFGKFIKTMAAQIEAIKEAGRISRKGKSTVIKLTNKAQINWEKH